MTSSAIEIRDLPDWPRFLSADEAARYLGVSRNVFDAEVNQGLWPKGIPRGPKGGKMTWDRKVLDQRSDLISGGRMNAEKIEDEYDRRWREAAARRQDRHKGAEERRD